MFYAIDIHNLSGTKAKKLGKGTFVNKAFLKDQGFHFNGAFWVIDAEISSDLRSQLLDRGIGLEAPMYLGKWLQKIVDEFDQTGTFLLADRAPVFKAKIRPELHEDLIPYAIFQAKIEQLERQKRAISHCKRQLKRGKSPAQVHEILENVFEFTKPEVDQALAFCQKQIP